MKLTKNIDEMAKESKAHSVLNKKQTEKILSRLTITQEYSSKKIYSTMFVER
jgi:hypothetical protein